MDDGWSSQLEVGVAFPSEADREWRGRSYWGCPCNPAGRVDLWGGKGKFRLIGPLGAIPSGMERGRCCGQIASRATPRCGVADSHSKPPLHYD